MTTSIAIPTNQFNRIYVNVDYTFSPVNHSIEENMQYDINRENTQLFHTTGGRSLVFNILNQQDGDINVENATRGYNEFGYFMVESDNIEDAQTEFYLQLNEVLCSNKHLLFYNFEDQPILMEIESINFEIDDFSLQSKIDLLY